MVEYDRYKASCLRAYNGRFGARYDSALEVRIFRPVQMDDWVAGVLGPGIAKRSILDVACGTGRLLERLARVGAVSLAGADLAAGVLGVARKRLRDQHVEADLQVADAETVLPWATDSFDVVTMTGALHHFLHPEATLGEIRRVLRSSGTLIIVDVCFRTPIREFMNLCMRVRPHRGDCHFWEPRQAMDLLHANAWQVNSWRRIGWWSFAVVAVPMCDGGGGMRS